MLLHEKINTPFRYFKAYTKKHTIFKEMSIKLTPECSQEKMWGKDFRLRKQFLTKNPQRQCIQTNTDDFYKSKITVSCMAAGALMKV